MSNSLSLILFAVLLGVTGQVSLKFGMGKVGQIDRVTLQEPFELASRIITNPTIILGLALYVVGAAVWLTVLSRVPLSFAYPILALTYAVTPVAAWLVLGETLPLVRWLGVSVICLGVVLVSRS